MARADVCVAQGDLPGTDDERAVMDLNGYLDSARRAVDVARLAAIELGLDEEKIAELLSGTLRECGVDVPEGLSLESIYPYLDKLPAYGDEEQRALSWVSGVGVDKSNVVIPDGTRRIGRYRFYYNSPYNRIEVPSSVVEIGENAFLRITSSQSQTVVAFEGRSCDEIKAMSGFPWGARWTSFLGSDGSITVR